MRITVRHNLEDLESDLRKIPVEARKDMRAVVRQAAITGNTVVEALVRNRRGA